MALGHPTREWSNRDSQLGVWNSSHLGVSVVTKTFRALAEHDFYSLAPALVNANELPLEARRRSRDVRAKRAPPGTAAAFRSTVHPPENIRSAEILRESDATPLLTNNPGPAAGGGYLRRP